MSQLRLDHGAMTVCACCDTELQGRRRRFCSRKCKNADTNFRHQSYAKQQQRGRARKARLIALFGGCCSRCGYRRNSAALEFHHVQSGTKQFQLDLRSLSNRTWEAVLAESVKYTLVCGNCHKEIHNPDCKMPGSAQRVSPERSAIK